MIVTKLQGGCGNQMFQYAMGLAQARRINTDLVIDNGSFLRDGMREYNLGLFPCITDTVVQDIHPSIHENGMPYNQALISSVKDGDVLKGYWQTEKYFSNVAEEIRNKFQAGPLLQEHRKLCLKVIEADNPTFLTIRRTDYVGNSFHGELPLDYYCQAIERITRETGKIDLFVFTDDIPWCQNDLSLPVDFSILGTYDRTVKGHIGREDVDLFLMSMCRNAIMANSSFSWWGAWLGDERRKGIVVAPKQWFGPTSGEDPRDIVPDRWVKI